MGSIKNKISTAATTASAVSQEAKKSGISVWKVFLPVLIGVTVVALMFWHDAKTENLAAVWRSIQFTPRAIFCIVLAFLFMFGRDFGLTWRFRALTDRQLRWGQAYTVDLLCEFTSCVTPSAVGGSSLGMVFLNSQGIEIGRATTLMITTLFLDELFFVIACPIVVLLSMGSDIFASGSTGFSHGIRLTFWIVYAFVALWTFLLFMGIIVKPKWIRSLLQKIFSLKWLRRWQDKAVNLGDNMVATSVELRKKPFRFWLEVFGGTAVSWTSRYLVVNALFFGFVPSADPEQWIILARQFVIWVVLMVSPTPGGSGLSEWIFSNYYGDLVPTAGMALILAVFWRIISYYVYLAIGSVLVPEWLTKSYNRLRNRNKPDDTAQSASEAQQNSKL